MGSAPGTGCLDMVQAKGLACRGQLMIFSQRHPFLSTLLPLVLWGQEATSLKHSLNDLYPPLYSTEGQGSAQHQFHRLLRPRCRDMIEDSAIQQVFTKCRLLGKSHNAKSQCPCFSHQREDFTLCTLKFWNLCHMIIDGFPCHLQGMKYSEALVL